MTMAKDIFKLCLIGVTLFAAGFFLKSVGLVENAARASDAIHSTFAAEDGLALHAWVTEARADSANHAKPGLALLLPMMSKTHESYEPFRKALNEINYTTIAFDLRGHGLSILRGSDTLSFADMPVEEFARMSGDIAAFFADFKAKNPDAYNYDDVVVIGASIGANTAGILLPQPWVRRAVLLSPGVDYRSLRPGDTMLSEKLKLIKSIYIAVSGDDTYASESSQWLFESYGGRKVLKKYPGQNHGTDILHNVENADKELLDWLKQK